jgi:hypothetical protein
VLERVERRVKVAAERFRELAESRTGDVRIQEQLFESLMRWFVVGRAKANPDAASEEDAPDPAIDTI